MKLKLLILSGLVFVSGCFNKGMLPKFVNEQRTELTNKNYRVLATAVAGVDSGILLLGIVPVYASSYSNAMYALHKNLRSRGIDINNKAIALINVIQEKQYEYYVIVGLESSRITADVIEFLSDDELNNKNYTNENKTVLSIVIIDQQQIPVENVAIVLRSGEKVIGNYSSDSKGEIRIENIAAGKYEITAVKFNYIGEKQEIELLPKKETTIKIKLLNKSKIK